MPVTDISDQSGSSSGLAARVAREFVGYIHPGVLVGGYNYGPTQGMKQSATPSFTTSTVKHNIAKDVYEISTPGKTLLQSTFTPVDSRRSVYHVTTDVASQNRATTILWRFDPGDRRVTEVARIKWWISGKTMVQMSGIHVPVAEFMTKSKWRVGMRSTTQVFTSETEEYMWVPEPTIGNAECCTWHCVLPVSRGTTVSSKTIAVYRPSFFREASQSSQLNRTGNHTKSNSMESRRPRTSESSFLRPRSRHGSVSSGGKGERVPAVLQMYPEVNSRPHLREIILLTVILVVAQKDEWRNLPHSWNVTTPDVVLSHLS